jgi:hypothetical protein
MKDGDAYVAAVPIAVNGHHPLPTGMESFKASMAGSILWWIPGRACVRASGMQRSESGAQSDEELVPTVVNRRISRTPERVAVIASECEILRQSIAQPR